MIRGIVLALAAAGAVAAAIAPATAAPIVRYNEVYDPPAEEFEDCGLALQEDAIFRFTGQIKASTPKTAGEYFRVHEHFSRTFVITNTENAKWVRVEDAGVFREGPGTIIEWDNPPKGGPVVSYTTKSSGALTTVYNSDGRVLLRDRGSISEAYIFDTGGDGAPGGGEFLGGELVKASGHLPSFALDDDALCELLNTWIG